METMKNETEIWKSRALAHEENYYQMLKRVDEARDAAEKAKAYKRVLKQTNAQLKRERDEARKWSAMLADAGDEIRAQLREEQQLHVQTLNELDEARETSWFSNGIEYRKRNDYIEARNNLNPHWVVVDSQTNQKP